MSAVTIGSNDFFGVPFPLVLADRFFHMYRKDGGGLSLDVFRWDSEKRIAVYEVKNGEPLQQNISSNPTGIVTFSREDDGTFLYKFRPRPGVSQIFGKVPVGREVEVRISDREILVMSGSDKICTIQNGQVSGMPIGVNIGANGSVGIGGGQLPSGMELRRV
jgi:hypothetical protein